MTTDTTQQIEQVELSITNAQAAVEAMNSLDRLGSNPDFKKLIHEGYFKEEASRLVLLKADQNVQSDEHQKQIEKSIDAIGYFRQYLGTIIQMGKMADSAMSDHEATLEELSAEELG